jgi:hypothetical protein
MPRRFERHKRAKQDWGLPPARSEEVREAARADPEPARRAPARKDTRRWCHGKPGLEHETVVVLHSQYGHTCGWREHGRWAQTGPVPPRGVTLPKWPKQGREWIVTGRDWSCMHEVQCQVCGKFLGTVAECPVRQRRAA